MGNNKSNSNNEKFEEFIKELDAVKFESFDQSKGYKENFKSLMKCITIGVGIINEYKNNKECKKNIPCDCASKINKQ